EFDSAGTPVAQFNAPRQNRGTDWIDLDATEMIIYYTSEGDLVKTYDLSGPSPGPDFASLPGTAAYGLRILPTQGVLVADTEVIVELNSTGSPVRYYGWTPTSTHKWSALSLDPTGTSYFWAIDSSLDGTTGPNVF